MPSRIDLTQFWIDYPEYVGKPKRYAVYGQKGAIGANALNVPIVVETEMQTDFIATAILCVPTVTAGPTYDPAPFLMQVEWPSRRQLVTGIPTSPLTRFEYAGIALTGFSKVWDWPYPVIIRQGGNIITTWDNTHATAVVMNVAFHGIRVQL